MNMDIHFDTIDIVQFLCLFGSQETDIQEYIHLILQLLIRNFDHFENLVLQLEKVIWSEVRYVVSIQSASRINRHNPIPEPDNSGIHYPTISFVLLL